MIYDGDSMHEFDVTLMLFEIRRVGGYTAIR